MASIAVLLLAGCGGAHSDPATTARPETVERLPEASGVAVTLRADSAPPDISALVGNRVDSRNYESDSDGDGIADYRVTVIESFDSTGGLLSRTKEQDFDADGIIDARGTTTFTGHH
jgi:hypothetical protein